MYSKKVYDTDTTKSVYIEKIDWRPTRCVCLHSAFGPACIKIDKHTKKLKSKEYWFEYDYMFDKFELVLKRSKWKIFSKILYNILY